MIAAPRGHAKSTILSLVYPLWCILTKRKKFLILISDSIGQAAELLGTIVEELETNERILEDFGKIAGYIPPTHEEKSKWTARDIVTLTGIKVIAASWTSRLRGLRYGAQRPDLIIVDDIENDQNVQSAEQRQKVDKVFRSSILNLGDETTQIIMVGTVLHYDALLPRLLADPPPNWATRFYTAYKSDGTPLWPEYWTLQRLEDKRAEIGSIAFEQEFMNNPLDEGSRILYRNATYDSVDMNFLKCFAYVDLASKTKEVNDYTAIVTVGIHSQTNKIYVVAADRLRGDIYKQIDLIYSHFDKFHHQKIAFEEVAYQTVLQQVIARETEKNGKYAGRYIPVVPQGKTIDKVQNAKSISAFCENGTVIFNNSFQEFNAEVDQFPKASHDDFVDALVGAVQLALSYGNTSSKIQSRAGIIYPKNL